MGTVFSLYIYTNGSNLIYASHEAPSPEDMELIERWMEVPSVSLVYSGPSEFLEDLKSALGDCGILEGGSTPLFVRVDTGMGRIAIWMGFEEKSWDDYDSPPSTKNALEEFKTALKELIGCREFPKEGFVIEFSPEGVRSLRKKGVIPSVQKFSAEDIYEVFIDGEATSLERGFHEVEGVIFYAGKRGLKVETAKFFKGATWAFWTGSDYAVLKDGILRLKDGKLEISEIPVGIWDGYVVLPGKVVWRDGERELFSTAIDTRDGVILEADGSVEAVDGSWRMKVSCTPLEWSWKDGILHILDVCGYYREMELKRRKVLREEKVNATGFDFMKGKVVFVTKENFCVVGDKKIAGDCTRLHNGYAIKISGNSLKVLGRGFGAEFIDYSFTSDQLIIRGDEGVWLVRFRK